jgi:hypothetical protein
MRKNAMHATACFVFNLSYWYLYWIAMFSNSSTESFLQINHILELHFGFVHMQSSKFDNLVKTKWNAIRGANNADVKAASI